MKQRYTTLLRTDCSPGKYAAAIIGASTCLGQFMCDFNLNDNVYTLNIHTHMCMMDVCTFKSIIFVCTTRKLNNSISPSLPPFTFPFIGCFLSLAVVFSSLSFFHYPTFLLTFHLCPLLTFTFVSVLSISLPPTFLTSSSFLSPFYPTFSLSSPPFILSLSLSSFSSSS